MSAGYFDGQAHPSTSLLALGASLGYTVLAVDRPGYGDSAAQLPEGATLAEQSAALHAGLEDFMARYDTGAGLFVLAHSYGGKLALTAAADDADDRWLGIDISGCGHRYAATAEQLPNDRRHGHWTLNWGKLSLYPPNTFRFSTSMVKPMPPRERQEVARWHEIFPGVAARVRVPVRLTFAEHETWWHHDEETVADLTSRLAAPACSSTASRTPATTSASAGPPAPTTCGPWRSWRSASPSARRRPPHRPGCDRGPMKKILTTTFRSLSVRNFRLFAGGQVVSVAGTWMMVVSQDWLVLGMTDDSGTALGLVTALQFTPLLLLTLYGGKLADRYDKRLLLTVSNVISGVFALALGLLVVTDAVELWHVYLFALALGTVNAVEVPTRMAFVSEMVGADLLPNASALSAAYFNVARVVGPAVAGLLITAWGTGPVMLINAVSYLGTVVGLRMMRPAELLRDARQSARGGVLDGLRYMRSRPDLMLPISLVAVIGLFGLNFQLTVPLIAKTVFDADATSFGLLTTSLAAGSLIAAFAATGRRAGRPAARSSARRWRSASPKPSPAGPPPTAPPWC